MFLLCAGYLIVMSMQRYKVLVLGLGGREYSIIDALQRSDLLDRVFTNNVNFIHKGEYVEISDDMDLEYIAYCCKENGINLVIIGEEKYLARGLTDVLQSEGIMVFGPTKSASRLEFSKSFAKEICSMYSIPTAHNSYFTDLSAAESFIRDLKTEKVVVKADGLCAGKGVFICNDHDEAVATVESLLGGKLGSAGNIVVVEEYLEGFEISFFVLCDGTNCMEFGIAQDHKQVVINDVVRNTGGMGGASPVPLCGEKECMDIMRDIIYPTLSGLKDMGVKYSGVLFAGIMMVRDDRRDCYVPKLLEYNVRFGDPETQMIIPRLTSDLLDLCIRVASGKLHSTQEIKYIDGKYTFCIVVASAGYPGEYKKGVRIAGIDKLLNLEDVWVYLANVKCVDGEYISTGGRILSIVTIGDSLAEAKSRAYDLVHFVRSEEVYYIEDM